jgi:hypothetical protein
MYVCNGLGWDGGMMGGGPCARQSKRFRKNQCPIVERLCVALMMHGRNSGKKMYVTGMIGCCVRCIAAAAAAATSQIRRREPGWLLITPPCVVTQPIHTATKGSVC